MIPINKYTVIYRCLAQTVKIRFYADIISVSQGNLTIYPENLCQLFVVYLHYQNE